MTKSTQSTHRLGVPGLPPVFDAMVVGGLYGLHCSSPPARAALVAHCLAHAVGMGPVAIITNGSPRRQLEHCAEVGVRGIDQALDTGALQVFRLKASSTKNIFRHGPSRLTQEAEHFNVPDEALIIFDGADDIFTLQDSFVVAEQVRVYHEWIRQRRGCGLMIFTQLATGSQYASAYTALLDHLDGVATLESGREHLSWVVNFWASPFGMVASRTLTTHIEAGGTLLVAPQMESDTLGPDSVLPSTFDANDDDAVFSMDSTLAGVAVHGQGKWVFCDSLVGVLHAARNARKATVILVFDQSTALRQLAEAAHTLRVNLGKRIHIVVRELNASLRYQNELLLLRLGVNMVIHRDVPVSQLMLALESLRGQVFDHNIEVDFEAALISVTPSRASGYLTPKNFSAEVASIVARSKSIGVPFSMVRITLPADKPVEVARDQFKMIRGGDIMTASQDHLLLFVSGCPESSLLPTLKRLGGDKVQDDFRNMEFALNEVEVQNLLSQLTLAAGIEEVALNA